jgi:hypothetical protein
MSHQQQILEEAEANARDLQGLTKLSSLRNHNTVQHSTIDGKKEVLLPPELP